VVVRLPDSTLGGGGGGGGGGGDFCGEPHALGLEVCR
jgi:hypothetical protein